MDMRLKQRIVGIVVVAVVLAAVILVMLTGSTRRAKVQVAVNTAIPKEPNPPVVMPPGMQAQAAWAVQLASFADKIHANNLVAKLQKAGFDAYVEQRKVAGSYVYRVVVGPETEKSKAEALLKQLTKQFKLKGIIVKYEV